MLAPARHAIYFHGVPQESKALTCCSVSPMPLPARLSRCLQSKANAVSFGRCQLHGPRGLMYNELDLPGGIRAAKCLQGPY